MKSINLLNATIAHQTLKIAYEDRVFYGKLPRTPESKLEELDHAVADARSALDSIYSDILSPVITEAEGKARVRTITPDNIMNAIDTIESHLGIAKTAMKGITATVNVNAQTFPNSYKKFGTPESTYFTIHHNGKTWYLDRIYRDTCRATKYSVTLTEEAKAAIIRNAETF